MTTFEHMPSCSINIKDENNFIKILTIILLMKYVGTSALSHLN